jgi:biopolymer transport protein ExbB
MQMILQWYQGGGPLVGPLVVVSALGIILLVERIVRIVFRARIHARPFMERAITLVRAGKRDEALTLCAEHQSALPDLGLVLLRSHSHDEAELRSLAEAVRLGVTPELTRGLPWLSTLAALAMLLGVVGTIVNLEGGLSADSDVAVGMARALRPLGVACVTAIPLLAGRAYLQGEADKLIAQMREFSARLINALIDRPDVRLGHRE